MQTVSRWQSWPRGRRRLGCIVGSGSLREPGLESGRIVRRPRLTPGSLLVSPVDSTMSEQKQLFFRIWIDALDGKSSYMGHQMVVVGWVGGHRLRSELCFIFLVGGWHDSARAAVGWPVACQPGPPSHCSPQSSLVNPPIKLGPPLKFTQIARFVEEFQTAALRNHTDWNTFLQILTCKF
jgi:hypothetical protein